ncbi:MAG TPA: TolC family protein [Myxococcota bacterium]|nr:TolC family protein [Myxococcota bacterium]
MSARRRAALVLAGACWLAPGPRTAAGEPTRPLDANGCVQVAVRGSARTEEAEARVRELQARLAEVESVYYPKLQATTFVTPMFTVRGNGLTYDVERRYKNLGDWGPYANLDALLALPVYTFGRAEKGAEAARQRVEVARARVREAANAVALETRRMYYTHLFAASMLPALGNASKLLADAVARAEALYDEGTGAVTQVDIAKLKYGAAEVARFTFMAEDGAALGLAALKHTMGMSEAAPLQLADKLLPDAPEVTATPLAALLQQAAEARPEWAQIAHGQRATLAWEEAERLANWPVVFVAGILRAAYTPTRQHDPNPYHYDIYNMVVGGAAVGLRFDLDPALASARADIAAATGAQVEALRRFAATGIPLQVRKAHDDLARARRTLVTTSDGVTATRKWMTFAAAAYTSGTGEARDLLEGLASYLSAKRTYFETLQGYYTAEAELGYAVGRP